MTNRLIRTARLPLAPRHQTPPSDPLPEGILALESSDRTLTVTYDLHRTDLGRIESWLSESGIALSQGLLARLRRRILAFKDDNRRDQAAIVHQCCNVPPPKGR